MVLNAWVDVWRRAVVKLAHFLLWSLESACNRNVENIFPYWWVVFIWSNFWTSEDLSWDYKTIPSRSKCGLELCGYSNWQENLEADRDHLKTPCVFILHMMDTHEVAQFVLWHKDEAHVLAEAQHHTSTVTFFSLECLSTMSHIHTQEK